jgi:hypothetical protein
MTSTSEERKDEMTRFCEKYGYEDSAKVYEHMAEKYPDVSKATHRGMFGRLVRKRQKTNGTSKVVRLEDVEDKLKQCGFHDGRKQVMRRPTKEITVPIPDTSRLYNYRTECSIAYTRAEEQGFDDAMMYLRTEWNWANTLIQDPKTQEELAKRKAAREAKKQKKLAAKADKVDAQGDLLPVKPKSMPETPKSAKPLPARKGREKLDHVVIKRDDTRARQARVLELWNPRATEERILRKVKAEFPEPNDPPTRAMIVQALKAEGDADRYAKKMEKLYGKRECPTCDTKAYMVDDIYIKFGFREKNARSQSYCRGCRGSK